ncbi:isochorismatase-like hydrolase [Coleophoma crateriformis]|uniref:Isochorismatase-like hydrolase n=1 Tax=Coleophoma crateriformis TaxID=565419 RepID=A0A3D8RQN4_9HELO|nr:isochorismatase-like hydrolase [Coleophoma crateriformis]
MAETVVASFGPPGKEWQYSPNTSYPGGTFDLSHGAAEYLLFQTTLPEGMVQPKSLGCGDAEVAIDPAATALVIVDMQNYFLDPACMEHPKGLAAVEPTAKAIHKCRQAGIQVIWLNWGLTDADMETIPAGVQRGFIRSDFEGGLGVDLGGDKGACLYANTWNADVYPPLKRLIEPFDVQCAKNRMSGLWSAQQPLFKVLQEKKISTLLFAGVNTDQCVLGTLVDGYNNGWTCVMIEDACGTTTAGAREVTLYNVSANYGFVTDSDAFMSGKVVAR